MTEPEYKMKLFSEKKQQDRKITEPRTDKEREALGLHVHSKEDYVPVITRRDMVIEIGAKCTLALIIGALIMTIYLQLK